jgi:hypothetical protein
VNLNAIPGSSFDAWDVGVPSRSTVDRARLNLLSLPTVRMAMFFEVDGKEQTQHALPVHSSTC